MAFDTVKDDTTIARAEVALKANGIDVIVVANGAEAKQKALELLPAGAEVMTMTSVTLDTIGLAQEINESGKFDSIRKKFASMDRATQGREMQKLGAAPEWTFGSVHAITEDGHIIIASATGSQLPAYAYGAGHVIWIAGAQKIVANITEGMQRISEYVFPLENERAQKAYGMGSGINKILIVNKEAQAGRITLIIIKKNIGF